MTVPISITQDNIYVALQAFIASVITDAEIVQGLANRVARPTGPHIEMTVLFFNRVTTNQVTYSDLTPTTGTENTQQSIKLTVQIDCYGPLSQDWAVMLTTLLRDSYGCDALAPVATPLHADDPKMIALVDSEMQYEQRWMVEAVLQYNPVIQTPMQFADTVTVTTKEVKATYP